MKKKSLFFWFVAFVCAALIFTGCPQEPDDDDTAKSGDAGLTSVLGQSITATGDGAQDSPKTAAITLAAAAADGAVKASDIVVAAKANAKLYPDEGFANEAVAETGIALPAGATTDVYVLVTAEDGATKLYYKVSIALPQTVTGYSLKASESSNEIPSSGVTLASATELDGEVTLKLGGEVTGEYILTSTASGAGPGNYTEGASFQPEPAWWVGDDENPAAGAYAAVYIKGLFTWESGSKVLAIKNTNQALRLYAGNDSTQFLETNPTAPRIAADSNRKTIWMPSDTAAPVRWKLYSSINKDETFGILIWNGGAGTTYTPKTATLVVEEYDGYEGAAGSATSSAKKTGGYLKTVVVDYSDVTFAPAVTYTDVTENYALASGDSNINTIGSPSNLSAVAKQRTVDGTVYITVTSTTALTGTDDFTDSNGLWGPKRNQAPTGKWADMAINFGAVFTPENAAKVLSIRSTSHAYRYYGGAGNIWNTLPAGPSSKNPATNANIYLPTSATELPVKWRIYDANTFVADEEAGYDVHDFGLLLWDGAPEKVITLEVYEHTTYTADTEYTSGGTLIAKIVIDYSNVDIN